MSHLSLASSLAEFLSFPKIHRLYPFHLPFSLSRSVSPSDILLTLNCGSPPPIAGINPHLRPPRHTVCSPTMHLNSKTFPDTFGLLSSAYLPLQLSPFTGSPCGSWSASFICSASFFLKLSKFPYFFLSIHSLPIWPKYHGHLIWQKTVVVQFTIEMKTQAQRPTWS